MIHGLTSSGTVRTFVLSYVILHTLGTPSRYSLGTYNRFTPIGFPRARGVYSLKRSTSLGTQEKEKNKREKETEPKKKKKKF